MAKKFFELKIRMLGRIFFFGKNQKVLRQENQNVERIKKIFE